MRGPEEAPARGRARARGSGTAAPRGPAGRPAAGGHGVPPREAAHLPDPPLDDGFGREDPLAHCRQLHLAQRHPQPIILPAPAAGAAPLAHAPQRPGPGGRAGARSRSSCGPSRDPSGGRAVARTSPSPGAVAMESESTRGGGARCLLKGPRRAAGALARSRVGAGLVGSWAFAVLRFPLPSPSSRPGELSASPSW